MKKLLALLIALLLLTSAFLTSCGQFPEDPDDIPDNVDEDEKDEVVEKIPHTVTERLVDERVMREIYAHFRKNEGAFKAMRPNIDRSYILCNSSLINDCTLTSITIPVSKTLGHEDGCFIFTLSVFGSNFSDLKSKPKRTYEVKVSATENDLRANQSDINKIIKVDLSSYNIVIGKDEVLGFSASGDTLIPAVLDQEGAVSNAYRLIASGAPYLGNSYSRVGTPSVGYTWDTLLFNLEWKKTYESEEDYLAITNNQAYEDMVKALKEKYEGKYISIMGDSISTFAGVSNDTTSNSTIGNNAVYYGPNSVISMPNHTHTYWGRLIKDIGMKACVINSWSGSTAYGENCMNMLERAVQLHRDNKTPSKPSDDIAPDVIIVYLGVNDKDRNVPVDSEIYGLLTAENGGTAKERLGDWMAKVIQNADKVGGAKKGTTFKNFEQAYALSIRAMQQKYPNAEIWCMTLQETMNTNSQENIKKLERYNTCIRGIAEYFGVGIIDQANDTLTYETAYQYSADSICLHPNGAGHKLMTEYIVKTWYEALDK